MVYFNIFQYSFYNTSLVTFRTHLVQAGGVQGGSYGVGWNRISRRKKDAAGREASGVRAA